MKKKIIIIILLVAFWLPLKTNALSSIANGLLDVVSRDRKIDITSFYFPPEDKLLSPLAEIQGRNAVIKYYLDNLEAVKTYKNNHKANNLTFNVFCQTKTNCGIMVSDSQYDISVREAAQLAAWEADIENQEYPAYGFVHFDITTHEKNVVSKVYNAIKSHDKIASLEGAEMPTYLLYDLGFINYWYNNTSLINEWNKRFTEADVDWEEIKKYESFDSSVNYFPGLKDKYENIGRYTTKDAHIVADLGEKYGYVYARQTPVVLNFYGNQLYYVDAITTAMAPIILVSNNSNDTLINLATARINEYLGSNHSVTITKKQNATNEINQELTEFLNAAFDDNKSYTSDVYDIKIGSKKTFAYIVKVSDSMLNKFATKSTNVESNLLMNTKGVDVPFDASLEVTDVTSSVQGVDKAYDINLYSIYKAGYVKESENGFNISIPVASNFKATGKKIYYIDSTGARKEAYDFEVETIDGQKYVTFTTNHLSTYALADETAPDNNTNNNNNTDKPKTNQKNTIKIQVPLKGDDVIKGTPNEETNEVINKYPVYVTQTVEEEIKSISLTVGNKAAEVKEVTFEGTEEYNATKDGDKVTFELKEGQTGKSGKKELVGYVVVKLTKDVETPFTVTNKKVNGVKTGATLPIVSGIILIAGLGVILLVNKKNKSFRNI